jgi:hypothetical protein
MLHAQESLGCRIIKQKEYLKIVKDKDKEDVVLLVGSIKRSANIYIHLLLV